MKQVNRALLGISASRRFTAAWRGGRGLTWLFGALTFFVAILTGLTGYVPQSNYDGQWIGQQAKEATNAIGMGGLLNLMDLDIVTGGTRARGLGRDAGVDAGGAGAYFGVTTKLDRAT